SELVRPLRVSSVNCLRDPGSGRVGSDMGTRRQRGCVADHPRELALDGLSERLFVGRREPVQDECVDRELDPGARHVQPPVSASVSGFSSFAYSLRAAWSTCDARTVPSPSDRKSTRLNSSHVAISYAV